MRVAKAPVFLRIHSGRPALPDRAIHLSASHFGSRFDPPTNAILACGAKWRLGAVSSASLALGGSHSASSSAARFCP